jgi:tetratricopeptide (TPR) repeat protein
MVDQGNTEREIDSFRGALTIYEEIGDPRGVASTALLLARAYFRNGKLRKALIVTKKALQTARNAGFFRPRVLLGALRRYRIMRGR